LEKNRFSWVSLTIIPNSVESVPYFGWKETTQKPYFLGCHFFFYFMCKERILFPAILMTNMNLCIMYLLGALNLRRKICRYFTYGKLMKWFRWVTASVVVCRLKKSLMCIAASLGFCIVNRGEWLWSPANIKGANKDAKIYVGTSATVHNLLFCAHSLCNTFLLISSSVSSKQPLCFLHGQG